MLLSTVALTISIFFSKGGVFKRNIYFPNECRDCFSTKKLMYIMKKKSFMSAWEYYAWWERRLLLHVFPRFFLSRIVDDNVVYSKSVCPGLYINISDELWWEWQCFYKRDIRCRSFWSCLCRFVLDECVYNTHLYLLIRIKFCPDILCIIERIHLYQVF